MGLFGPSGFAGGGATPPVVTNFASSGTWNCCPGAKTILVVAIGGGGGGGDSVDCTTSGQPTFYIAGGGGGGGGGISVCCFTGSAVCATGTVTVGLGGSRGIPATNGGNSCFVSGTATLCAQGGRLGQYSCVINGNNSLWGDGGAGNAQVGNHGGNGCALQNGGNAQALDGAARGGAGGGGVRYCNVLPVSCTFTNPGSVSPVSTFDLPQLSLCLNSAGRGGNGGNASVDFNRTPTGTNGNSGFVTVVQYF